MVNQAVGNHHVLDDNDGYATRYGFAQQPLRSAGQIARIDPSLGIAEFAVHSHRAIIDVQTRPSGPARGPARVNSKVGDDDSPG